MVLSPAFPSRLLSAFPPGTPVIRLTLEEALQRVAQGVGSGVNGTSMTSRQAKRVKILGLLRHAKSDWGDSDKRDFDRGLNVRGRKGAALMGAHIREYGVRWDMLLASPAERVRRTLEAAELGKRVDFDERLYLADT